MLPTVQLAEEITGRVITPEDPDYEGARTVFLANFDRRPQLIVRPADAEDVARVVALARETGVELAVRNGGHSSAGHGTTDGGIVLDLSELRSLEIDPDRRIAWAGAGLTTGAYTAAAAEHGLATGFGDTGSVGLGGITLAGGIGYLVRKHGLAIDNLLAAEVVTADGEFVRADAEHHPDLFWALRGGGGNFGVVTRFAFRLHEVSTIVGGMLVLPATPELVLEFLDAAEAAPDELSTIASVMKAPPMPFLPAEIHGKHVILAMMAYAGEDGERALAPFRELATPLADMLQPMPYRALFPDEGGDFRRYAAMRTMLTDHFDRDAAKVAVEQTREATAPMAAVQLRALGGAMARVPVDATAFAHRDRRFMVTVAAMYQDPAQTEQLEAWVTGLAGELDPGDAGAYAGFLGDEGQERLRAAYPEATYTRLAAVKRQYDPDNVFRLNHNIEPA